VCAISTCVFVFLCFWQLSPHVSSILLFHTFCLLLLSLVFIPILSLVFFFLEKGPFKYVHLADPARYVSSLSGVWGYVCSGVPAEVEFGAF